MGSWRFVIVQSVIVALWIVANAWLLTRPFDPEPFIALNLLFSVQAAYASPLILMASNRQATRDRKRDDQEAEEVRLLYAGQQSQQDILSQIKTINEQQTEILNLLKERKWPSQTDSAS